MKPRYNLNNIRDGKANLILRYSYKPNTRLKYGVSNITINIKDWDSSKQRVRRSEKYYSHYNDHLEYLEHLCIEIRQKYRDKLDKLTIEVFKDELNKAQGIIKVQRLTFVKFFKQYIGKYDAGTKRAYKTTLSRLDNFTTYYKSFDFEDINLKWLSAFEDWCFLVKNFSPNSAQKSLAHVKKVLRESYEDKLHNNDIFTHKKFNIKKVETESVYLSLDELAQIYRYKFTDHLEGIRDLFVLACFTGQRVSDWSKLNENNLVEEQGQLLFNFLSQKTKSHISIPLHPVTKWILEKYNYNPPTYADQYINRSIKEICKLSGIDNIITRTEYQHGKPILKKYKKYELITSHTARRSFATNMYLSGVDLDQIKHITGHTKTSTLEIYIKASSLDRGLIVSRSDFFRGKGFLKVV